MFKQIRKFIKKAVQKVNLVENYRRCPYCHRITPRDNYCVHCGKMIRPAWYVKPTVRHHIETLTNARLSRSK